jgi:hypothetical protein
VDEAVMEKPPVMEPTGILRYSDNIYSGSEEKTRKKAKNKN